MQKLVRLKKLVKPQALLERYVQHIDGSLEGPDHSLHSRTLKS